MYYGTMMNMNPIMPLPDDITVYSSPAAHLFKEYPSPSVLVSEFHTTYGLAIRHECIYDIPEKEMRMSLIREEISELKEANQANDFVEMVDAWADLVYVIYGAALTHGVDLDHILNYTIFRNSVPGHRVHDYVDPQDRPSVPVLDVPQRMDIMATMDYLSQELEAGYQRHDLLSMAFCWAYMVRLVYEAASYHGVDLDSVLEEVQRSNMSKLDEFGKPIYREDGKVLKGPNFFAPDIQAVLMKNGYKPDDTKVTSDGN